MSLSLEKIHPQNKLQVGNKVTRLNLRLMGLNLQPDGLTASSAGLAGQCQLEKNIHSLKKKKK